MQSKRVFVILAGLLVLVGFVGFLNLYSAPEVLSQNADAKSGIFEQTVWPETRPTASEGDPRAFAKESPTEQSPKKQFPAAPAPIPPWYTVARVVDGDTIVLDVPDATGAVSGVETVRLIGLDTPEVVDPKKPVQCFGPEASAEAEKLLLGQTVRLEADPTQDARDVYGRVLGYIFLPDGTNVNELMIAEGYGREYTFKKPYEQQKEFRAAQAAAKAAGKGLWSACAK